jgi:hypothetical protein
MPSQDMASGRAAGHIREEVYNVKLAELLAERGAIDCTAEQVHSEGIPDVLGTWYGVRFALEAKYDQSGAGEALLTQVTKRLKSGFGVLGIAVVYPEELGHSTQAAGRELSRARLQVRFLRSGGRPGAWHDVLGVDGLVALLSQARDLLVGDDRLSESVELLQQSVDAVAVACKAQPGHAAELVALVTALDAVDVSGPSPEQTDAAFRIAALAVATASMVQVTLADIDPYVPKLPHPQPANRRRELLRSWREVLAHDYSSIFDIAYSVLDTLGDAEGTLASALGTVIENADEIAAHGVLGRHDLVGRVYHTLLAQQKYLATYYTGVPAATLLTAWATNAKRWPQTDWAADAASFDFNFVDPACGTGTLLGSALVAVRDQWVAHRLAQHLSADPAAFGRRMIENNIVGMDILAYALQVCGATMLLAVPGATVSQSRLYQMAFGGDNGYLGSLDLLFGGGEALLFGMGADLGDSVGLNGVTTADENIPLPEVDLVVMNPPFTRSQGGSRLLGSLDANEFPIAHKRLVKLAKRIEATARMSAGLGALFVPLAHQMLKPGGRLALVLPKSMLTGAQWDRTRNLLASNYDLELVILSHESGHWNFSDSTDLSEALLVARKREPGQSAARSEAMTTWVQLSKNPRRALDALAVESALEATPLSSQGRDLTIGSTLFGTVGQVFTRPAPTDDRPWISGTFYNEVLLRAAEALIRSEPVPLPRVEKPVSLPLRALSQIANVGFDRRDITDAFELAKTAHGYPALWGTDAQSVTSLQLRPNAELAPRTVLAPHRKRIKPFAPIWATAGHLLLAERLWLVTMRTTAAVMPVPCLANTWWSARLHSSNLDDAAVVALWLNSTLGLLGWMASSDETRGPWAAIKKNRLLQLPVPDLVALDRPPVRGNSRTVRAELLTCWEDVKDSQLLPIAQAAHDPVRTRIDAAFGASWRIADDVLDLLRQILSAEPKFQPRVPDVPEAEIEHLQSLSQLGLFGD